MFRRFGLIALFGLVLCACTAEPDITRDVPQDQFGFATQFMNQVQAGAVDAVLTSLDPSVNKEQARAFFENAAQNFPKAPIRATRVIDWVQIFQSSSGIISTVSTGDPNEIVRYRMVLRYVFNDTEALDVFMVLGTSEQGYFVSLVNFQPRTQADIDANAFLASGKSILNYLYFVAAVGVFVLILVSLFFCIRGPGPRWRWRWLWVIFILIAFGRASMVWTTGDMNITALSAVLFGLEFRKLGIFGPWVFFTGVPVGAIAFWAFRWRWVRQHKAALAAPTANDEDLLQDSQPQ